MTSPFLLAEILPPEANHVFYLGYRCRSSDAKAPVTGAARLIGRTSAWRDQVIIQWTITPSEQLPQEGDFGPYHQANRRASGTEPSSKAVSNALQVGRCPWYLGQNSVFNDGMEFGDGAPISTGWDSAGFAGKTRFVTLSRGRATRRMRPYEKDPAAIYAASFATVRAEANLARFDPAMEAVAVRLIHACGMVEIADRLAQSPDAAAIGQTALRSGAPILCDCEMVASGIIRRTLPAENTVPVALHHPDTPSRPHVALPPARSA